MTGTLTQANNLAQSTLKDTANSNCTPAQKKDPTSTLCYTAGLAVAEAASSANIFVPNGLGTIYVAIGACLIVIAFIMFSCQIHYLCVIFGHRKLYKQVHSV